MDYITGLGIGAILVALVYVAHAVEKAKLATIKRIPATADEMRRENRIDAEAASRAANAQRERDAVFNRLWNLPAYMPLDALSTVYVIRHSASDFRDVCVFVDFVKVARYVSADPDGTCTSGARVFRPDIWIRLWPWLRDYDVQANRAFSLGSSRVQSQSNTIHWFYGGAGGCGGVATNVVWGGTHSSDKNT